MNQTETTQVRRMDKNSRREAIMKAALEIFNEKGYEGTSLNAIIERVGGSKRNFYTEFGGKEGLFEALVTERMDRQIRVQEVHDAEETSLRGKLLGGARLVVKGFDDPELLALYRFMIQDGIRFPELVKVFFEGAHLKAEGYIARLLEKAVAEGEAKIFGPPEVVAGHFLSMLHGGLFYELLFNMRGSLTDDEVETFIHSAVDLFLNGILRRDEKAPG